MTLLTINETASLLTVGRSTVYRLIDQGELPAYKIGGCVRVNEEDIHLYLKRHKKSTLLRSLKGWDR
jgi:excisionase family DNA binding protein